MMRLICPICGKEPSGRVADHMVGSHGVFTIQAETLLTLLRIEELLRSEQK